MSYNNIDKPKTRLMLFLVLTCVVIIFGSISLYINKIKRCESYDLIWKVDQSKRITKEQAIKCAELGVEIIYAVKR